MDSAIRVVVGLGNPGGDYARTRHNAGAMALDVLCERLRISLTKRDHRFLSGRGVYESKPLLLVFPLTYMNRSGIAVRAVAEQSEIPLEQLLIVCDDFSLPLGEIRFRARGSSGGHNGLGSIIESLDTQDVPRLRLGIAAGSLPDDKQDFVLKTFKRKEQPLLNEMLQRAADGVSDWVTHDMNYVMTAYNKRSTGLTAL